MQGRRSETKFQPVSFPDTPALPKYTTPLSGGLLAIHGQSRRAFEHRRLAALLKYHSLSPPDNPSLTPSEFNTKSQQHLTVISHRRMAVTKGRASLPTTKRRPVDAVSSIAKYLNQKRIKDARRRNRTKLSPEGHRALRDKMNSSGSLAPNHADTTMENIRNIVRRFIGYSEDCRIRACRPG